MRSDGTPSNYWITFFRACEAAHNRYRAAAEACGGDDAAISKIVLQPAAEPLPGRWDRMRPHLRRCRFVDLSVFATGAGGSGRVRSGGSSTAPASSRIKVKLVDEEAMRDQLGVTKAEVYGVRAYLVKSGPVHPGSARSGGLPGHWTPFLTGPLRHWIRLRWRSVCCCWSPTFCCRFRPWNKSRLSTLLLFFGSLRSNGYHQVDRWAGASTIWRQMRRR